MATISKRMIAYDDLEGLYDYFEGVISNLITTELDPKRPELQRFVNDFAGFLNDSWDLLESVNERCARYDEKREKQEELVRQLAETQKRLAEVQRETDIEFNNKALTVSQGRDDVTEAAQTGLVWTREETRGMDDPFDSDSDLYDGDVSSMLVSAEEDGSGTSAWPDEVDFSTIDANDDRGEDLDDPYDDDELFQAMQVPQAEGSQPDPYDDMFGDGHAGHGDEAPGGQQPPAGDEDPFLDEDDDDLLDDGDWGFGGQDGFQTDDPDAFFGDYGGTGDADDADDEDDDIFGDPSIDSLFSSPGRGMPI